MFEVLLQQGSVVGITSVLIYTSCPRAFVYTYIYLNIELWIISLSVYQQQSWDQV